MPVAAVRHRLAWHLWMLRRGQHEVRRLNAKLRGARGRQPDIGRLMARYQRGVDEDAAAVLQLRSKLTKISDGPQRQPDIATP
ncbi:hypothetical protein [Stenotrophomonas maltophilia]|uniref:hypothetical protein n=1 Tax=Stenotrophomonas maltophilia TaxID=40324 RepID=UPI0024488D07|nr:hypothetical protein [Stenotrophomonas maltophilia]MDH0740926.1 hypothetical protein [Stenotrophomonas maltophilia]MDH1328362.1 hypothetical protein [Stenotrophomonas maltophilia]